MKGFARVTFVVLLFFISVCSVSAQETKYEIPEHDIVVSVDQEFEVFTYDDFRKGNMGEFTGDASDLIKSLQDQDIYMIGYNSDFTKLFSVKVLETDETRELNDFRNYSEEEINDFMDEMIGEMKDSFVSEVYALSDKTYIQMSGVVPNEQAAYEQRLMYITILGGKAIYIILESEDIVTSTDRYILKNVARSLEVRNINEAFGIEDPEEASNIKNDPQDVEKLSTVQLLGYDSWSLYIIGLAMGLVLTFGIYTLPILIYRRFIARQAIESKTAWMIAIGYGVFGYFVMAVIMDYLEGEIGGAIVLWTWINHWILTKKKKVSYPVSSERASTNAILGGSQITEKSFEQKGSQETPIVDEINLNEGSEEIHLGEGLEVEDETKYCHKCGKRLVEGSFFCNKCGAQVINDYDS